MLGIQSVALWEIVMVVAMALGEVELKVDVLVPRSVAPLELCLVACLDDLKVDDLEEMLVEKMVDERMANR